MAQLVVGVRAQAQLVGRDAEVEVPLVAGLAPVLVPLAGLVRRDEELHLHLLELTGAEHEVARRDLVAERLADLGDAERRLLAAGVQHVGEVEEHALRGLGAQVGLGRGALDGARVGLEHEVELAGLGERAALAAVGAQVGVVELVEAEALVAVAAVDERVGEVREVPGRLPHRGRREDRRVEARRRRRGAAPSSATRRPSRCGGGAPRWVRSRRWSGSRRRSRRTGTRSRAACTGSRRCPSVPRPWAQRSGGPQPAPTGIPRPVAPQPVASGP